LETGKKKGQGITNPGDREKKGSGDGFREKEDKKGGKKSGGGGTRCPEPHLRHPYKEYRPCKKDETEKGSGGSCGTRPKGIWIWQVCWKEGGGVTKEKKKRCSKVPLIIGERGGAGGGATVSKGKGGLGVAGGYIQTFIGLCGRKMPRGGNNKQVRAVEFKKSTPDRGGKADGAVARNEPG